MDSDGVYGRRAERDMLVGGGVIKEVNAKDTNQG